ncbi:uncharacterized protein LOC135335006 [Halichondria panicea]|uniref:uncharacterized protein LOC135335006 n=1 Tax=Halichondria panicea TaxID=6063 RepID=UPI00312B8F40
MWNNNSSLCSAVAVDKGKAQVFRPEKMQQLKVLAFLLLLGGSVQGSVDLYSLELTTIRGEQTTMAKYKGKVLLIVNVASECGYTDSNYKELVQLQSEYEGKGFTVLGFPSNQFGRQEPGSNKNILDFATTKYAVNFPLFSKIDVLGDKSCDLYNHLYSQTSVRPSWNFCKYLLDADGNVVQFFSAQDALKSVRSGIQQVLNSRTEL